MTDWKVREEQAATDLGMTRQQYRILLITRNWPFWLIGHGPRLRKRLAELQSGRCAMHDDEICLDTFTKSEVRVIHHIRPRMEFVQDDIPIREAIERCWADDNLQLVHGVCHKKKHHPTTRPQA